MSDTEILSELQRILIIVNELIDKVKQLEDKISNIESNLEDKIDDRIKWINRDPNDWY